MRAVGAKVIIRKFTQDEKLPSGLYMAATAKESNVCRGKVVSVANGYVENGCHVSPPFYEGETVGFYLKNAVKIDGHADLYFTDISNVIYVEDKDATDTKRP